MSSARASLGIGAVLALLLAVWGIGALRAVRAYYAETARTEVVMLRQGPPGQGIWGVWTGHSFAYGIESSTHQVALIDSGSDPKAAAILAQLSARGMTADNVETIVLTHGHDEVTAGLSQFARATIYVGDQDRILARRDALPTALLARLQAKSMRTQRLPKMAMQVMWPGQDIELAGIQAKLVALPGHTWGSFAVVAANIAFVGDSINAAKPEIDIYGRALSVSPKHNSWALPRLAQQSFSSIATTHQGVRPWSQAMLAQWLGQQPSWASPRAAAPKAASDRGAYALHDKPR